VTPAELDEWRWLVATSLASAPQVSGFDRSKDRLMLDWLTRVANEYRRLVIADERPAPLGRQEAPMPHA
jgi:hypothetical protein